MEQKVVFEYVDDDGKVLNDIECKVEWESDGSYDVDFFDRQTGYTSRSSPEAAQQNWSYQNPEEQEIIRSLIEAVFQFQTDYDWTEWIAWEDGAKTTFTFTWDGVSRVGFEGEFRELTRKS